MEKPLVFANATVELRDKSTLETWELIAVGPSPILHAIWDRNAERLTVQFNTIKEETVPYERIVGSNKNPKKEWAFRKEDRYYITRIGDKGAVEAILKNFVVNYDNQEWDLPPIVEEKQGPVPVESEV